MLKDSEVTAENKAVDHGALQRWLLATAFFSLSFTEWRVIDYQLFGPRSASFADVFFFTAAGFLLVIIARQDGFNYLLRQVAALWYLLLPILLMTFLYSDQASINPSFNRYQLYGCGAYMVLSGLVLARYAEEKILTYLTSYILVTAVFFLLMYVFVRFIPWQPFMYGQGTPALHAPFSSPNQAALFGVLNLMLGVGVSLAARKFYLLYLVVPIMTLVVFQTSSRSAVLLLIIGGVAFALLVLAKWIYRKSCQWRELIHLLLSAALACTLLFMTLTPQSARPLSIFNYSVTEILTGKVDNYRNKLWSMMLLDGLSASRRETLLPVGLEGGAHNAYLDLWLNWGRSSLFCFLAFMLVLLSPVVRLLWINRGSASYPLYAALLIGCGIIFGAIYANPLVHLKFVWVFFGLIISRLLFGKHSNKNNFKS